VKSAHLRLLVSTVVLLSMKMKIIRIL